MTDYEQLTQLKSLVRRMVNARSHVVLDGTLEFSKVAKGLAKFDNAYDALVNWLREHDAREEAEWEQLDKDAPTSEEFRAVAKYLKDTGRDAREEVRGDGIKPEDWHNASQDREIESHGKTSDSVRQKLLGLCIRVGVNHRDKWLSECAIEAIEILQAKLDAREEVRGEQPDLVSAIGNPDTVVMHGTVQPKSVRAVEAESRQARKELSPEEARKLKVCRICQTAAPGDMAFDFGAEYAHASCLEAERQARKELEQ